MNKIFKIFRKKYEKKPKAKINGNNGQHKPFVQKYFWSILVLFSLILIISLMLPRGRSYKYTDLKEGEVYVGDEIIAPFNFAINKTDAKYSNDLKRAEGEVLTVFVRSDSICDYQLQKIETFFDSLESIYKLETQNVIKIKKLTNQLQLNKIKSSDEILNHLVKESKEKTTDDFKQVLTRLVRDVCSLGILSLSKDEIKKVDNKILIITDVEEVIEDIDVFYDKEDIDDVLVEKLRTAFENDDLRVRTGYEILSAFIFSNIIYDAMETEQRVVESKNNVPLAKGTVLANERIIDRYERVTKGHIAKLNSLSTELAERESGKGFFVTLTRFIGKFLLIGFVIGIFVVFLVGNRSRTAKDFNKILLIAIIFLIVVVLTYNINHFMLSPYLIPITIGAMLLTIFFDTRVGFVGTIVLAIIIGILRGNEFNIAVISILAGTVAVLSVSRIRKRNWLVNSIMLIIGSYIFSIAIFEVLNYTPFKTILQYWWFAAINGFLSPLFCYGLQVIFENIFSIVTDMRLLELSDLNNPILRKLSIEAPGTYHHSLMVGNLAEAAAEAIEADSLLARVGSYYHDIGKMEKPEYFIENQRKNRNPHEKLSPSMSCLILANHVKQGQEIAKEYKLPNEIRDFISEHHGTNMMSYFYQKALEKKNDEEIDESGFRYPGPKPKTKETGIVMLADAIEAAARTLKDPSASRIKGMVISIVHERFRESELDDSPLKLQDLTKIIDSFQTVLLGSFHGRIEYPDQDEKLTPTKVKKIKEKNVELSN
ncbi:HDIG domain-containing protein [candidate division KSB1 bacterium]|nr:HDIG domain-containing protein [candidate division KSB1 bacterium]MBL7095086.1 HDIG domain-containing protein [candidate division KSB1 bacterium]